MYPNRPLDSDIQHSLKNLKDQEAKHGNWNYPKDESNVDISSIPACTSLGCKTNSLAKPGKLKYPINYPVPNFGLDPDIIDTQANENLAVKQYKHEWNPKWDAEKEKFEVPKVDAFFKWWVQTDADIKM